MIPLSERIVYDDREGHWRVMFGGKLVKQLFKTAGIALAFLEDLKRKKTQPEYEK